MRRPRPWRTLWGRLALGTIAGLLVAAIVVAAVAAELARRQSERTARDEFDRQAVAIGAIVSRRAERAIESGQEVQIPNLEALVGPGTEFGYVGVPLNPGGEEPLRRVSDAVGERVNEQVLATMGLQRIDVTTAGGARRFATAVPLLIAGEAAGAVVVSRPASEFAVPLGDVLPGVLLATGSGLAVALIVILVVARLVTRRLRTLEAGTAQVARGDLAVALPRGGAAEIDALAAAFNEMVRQLRERNATARDFLMRITHDLRTPLTAIRGHAAALADGIVPEELRERSLAAIASEAERLEALVADLLDLARLQAHRIRLDLAEVAAGEILEPAVEAFSVEAARRGIAYERRLDPLPPVLTDAARVRQIVANLIDNALRWTPSGGTVRVEARARPGGGLTVTVVDTGPGIADEEREAIFEPFWSQTTPDGRQGTGLGLAISRQLARTLGGDLRVESRPGAGCRFTLELPARATQPAPALA
jgi:signal transduction histidine kinase